MLSDFPRRRKALGQAVPTIFSAVAGTLTPTEVTAELDAGRPVIIGISPGQQFQPTSINPFFPAMHVALIVGHVKITNDFYVINDPFPFHKFVPFNQNPYVLAGGVPLVASQAGVPSSVAYLIPASYLSQLHWTESILVRVEP
jgi:hypothetical protein